MPTASAAASDRLAAALPDGTLTAPPESGAPPAPVPPPAPTGFGLPRAARLITQRDFRRVYGSGRRAHGKMLVVVGLRRRDQHHRLGLAVSKEHGGAVRRNKFKRILREAFRLERPTLPGGFDLVLIPRRREDHLLLREVRAELQRLVAQLASGSAAGGRPRGRGKGRQGGRPKGRPQGPGKGQRPPREGPQ